MGTTYVLLKCPKSLKICLPTVDQLFNTQTMFYIQPIENGVTSKVDYILSSNQEP